MRVLPVRALSALVVLLIASSARAVTMDWSTIGDPGNACDPQPDGFYGTGCFGTVGYSYYIGTFEVTNAQYAEFLNAKAASDPLGLFNPGVSGPSLGGIARSGSDGSYTYTPIAGRENMPVSYVSFDDALRFANWMNNGQGNGDTETGAYTLLGGTQLPSNWDTVYRNPGATIALTSDDEWFKAAYYNPLSSSYYDYATASDAETICSAPSTMANRANCDNAVGDLTNVGSYTSSASPYGTFDQAGNVFEWDEFGIRDGTTHVRFFRGGNLFAPAYDTAAWATAGDQEDDDDFAIAGFRLVQIPGGYIPEPSTGLLVVAGILGLAGWRRVNA